MGVPIFTYTAQRSYLSRLVSIIPCRISSPVNLFPSRTDCGSGSWDVVKQRGKSTGPGPTRGRPLPPEFRCGVTGHIGMRSTPPQTPYPCSPLPLSRGLVDQLHNQVGPYRRRCKKRTEGRTTFSREESIKDPFLDLKKGNPPTNSPHRTYLRFSSLVG